VATLRAKLQTGPTDGNFIQTIRDIGYRFDEAEATSSIPS
jgi:DNA-binding response OmpR family regulator